MQLQGIVFIQLQRNYILVNCQGNTDSFKEHIFIHKKYNHWRQLYSFTESHSFQGTYQFILVNISPFKENIFIQGYYIHSRIYINVRNIYSFKVKAICSFKETTVYSLNIVAFADKNCPQPLYDNYKLYNYYLLNKV